ncbi:MAG: metalloregulator ArsR/SmtB family transcription factor [Oceanospirillaceae bacterium]|nr:metalloregulator ArsR/SmtB family transcription factor [Oceanospirillaceae bacterium]
MSEAVLNTNPGAQNSLDPVSFFKNLADETRLLCLLLLAGQGELCVCELVAAIDDSQPKISRHLAQLRSAGLVSDRRSGLWVYYQLHTQLPAWCHKVLQDSAAANPAFLHAAQARLCTMENRPAKSCC